MFSLKQLISWVTNAQNYIWVETRLLKETPKAIKILFDGKEIWLPKAEIAKMKRNKSNNMVKIYISQYFWAKRR